MIIDVIDLVLDGITFPIFLLAVALSWGGVHAGVRRLDAAHKVFMLTVAFDLARLGFDITSNQHGARYWVAVIAQTLIIGVTVYLMVRTGRDADLAEKRAMAKLTGDA